MNRAIIGITNSSKTLPGSCCKGDVKLVLSILFYRKTSTQKGSINEGGRRKTALKENVKKKKVEEGRRDERRGKSSQGPVKINIEDVEPLPTPPPPLLLHFAVPAPTNYLEIKIPNPHPFDFPCSSRKPS